MTLLLRVSTFGTLLLLNCNPIQASSSVPSADAPSQVNEQATDPVAVSSAAEHVRGGPEVEPDRALIVQLADSKLTLDQALQQAEALGGVPISAKFELDATGLSLSVYTAKSGLELDAERNTLAELSGDPRHGMWHPREDVFADRAHIARASYYLTLMQRSGLSLREVLAKATLRQTGNVYSITPAAQKGALVFHILVATTAGGHVALDIDG